MNTDLWKQPIGTYKRKGTQKKGHAGPPGSGPKGETCGTCAHLARIQHAKSYLKCGLCQKNWTGGPGTDVRAKDAACWKWQPITKTTAH